MHTKKVFWMMISVCAVIVCWAGTRSLGDNAHFYEDPSTREPLYSGKAAASIGAWYDERWQASSFFLLRLSPSSDDEYRYERVSDPVAATNNHDSVFHSSKTDSSSIPQDVAVTSWRVTGHVHFASGM